MGRNNRTALDRRTYLKTVGSLAGAGSVAGCTLFQRGEDASTGGIAEDRARELAERFAPTLYFDEHERWFPTDPRPFESERDGVTVVDGFAAFDGYTDQANRSDEPPAATVFYNAVEYEKSPLAVVQYWSYSVFDQFTTNFHWHDWEVLHVFVDTETANPQLYVASSHSGRVPNNEFLDPEADQVPRILSELGSHSSALSLNDSADRFQRFPDDGTFADITNAAIEGIEDLANIPLAYGLPRDEGFRLPYLVPELDNSPIYEHDRLPTVERDDLVAEALTVRSFADLASPPADLPSRATGKVFGPKTRPEEADHEYDLVPSKEVEHVSAFTGPQLGFEFLVPEFGEDAIANHITTTGVPWDQPRYTDPAADISDPTHRGALADRYDAIAEPASINTLLAGVTEAVTNDDAPEDEGLTTRDPTVEALALVESKPEAVPSFGGIIAVRDVPEGEHRLTVNGAGVEPHSEAVPVSGANNGLNAAGVAGEIPLVARESSTKLEVDPNGTDADLTDLAVEDDFAGRLYDAPLSGPDAVYVHRGGAYTTEVRDADGEIGAFRINPAEEAQVRIDSPQTGVGSLAEYVAAVAEETSAAVRNIEDQDGEASTTAPSEGGSRGPVDGLARALSAVAAAARRAADRAAADDRTGADQRLANVQDRLNRVSSRLAEAADALPEDLHRAVGHRFSQIKRRTEQAREAGKL